MQTQILRPSFAVTLPAQTIPLAPGRSFLSSPRTPLAGGQSQSRSRSAQLQVSAQKNKKPSLFVEDTGSPNPTILALGVLGALVVAALTASLFVPKYQDQAQSGEKAFQADISKEPQAEPLPTKAPPTGYGGKNPVPDVKAEGKKGQPAGL